MSAGTVLVFECGARLPREGALPEPYADQAEAAGSKPRKDGRYRLMVYDSEAREGEVTRPQQPDGQRARCRFGCPCKRAAGRAETFCMPERPTPGRPLFSQRRTVITCYPKEVPA